MQIAMSNPANPAVINERRLDHVDYHHVNTADGTVWVSSDSGTEVLNYFMGDVTRFGPEYFTEAAQMTVSHDTIFIADGQNGIKIFRFNHRHPYTDMHLIGDYQTGNYINQFAWQGNNFYTCDYYSLQHQRWGNLVGIHSEPGIPTPSKFEVFQNFPNPFNSSTTLKYSIPANLIDHLTIFDILGRKVR